MRRASLPTSPMLSRKIRGPWKPRSRTKNRKLSIIHCLHSFIHSDCIVTFVSIDMVSSSFVFLVISLISLGTSDIACVTAGQPGCSSPYPPGHHFMGPSWYAIGRETFNTTILSMSTTLYLSEAPTNITGTLAVNAALENTVCCACDIQKTCAERCSIKPKSHCSPIDRTSATGWTLPRIP